MAVLEVLERLGGVATRRTLVQICGRADVERVLQSGDVAVVAWGRYALPGAKEAVLAAHRVVGVVSHGSAALRHGWPVLKPPKHPDVMLPKHRRRTTDQLRGINVHWGDLAPDEIEEGVTTRPRTLRDCLRGLPFLEALAIADSALHAGFDRAELLGLVRDARGPGSAQMRTVAGLASPLAANPFESALRGIAFEVAGLDLQPQVPLHDPGFIGRPDLVDTRLGIVVEADSFEWHGRRSALDADCVRYNRFVTRGWLVLRFSWEAVMFRADEVREVLEAAVGLRTDQLCVDCRAA